MNDSGALLAKLYRLISSRANVDIDISAESRDFIFSVDGTEMLAKSTVENAIVLIARLSEFPDQNEDEQRAVLREYLSAFAGRDEVLSLDNEGRLILSKTINEGEDLASAVITLADAAHLWRNNTLSQSYSTNAESVRFDIFLP